VVTDDKGDAPMVTDFMWRLIGLVLTGAGGALAWFFGFRPLQEARAGAAEVSYSVKLFVAAPLAIVLGLALLIGGARLGALVGGPPRTREQHLATWPLVIVATAAGLAAWWWFDGELRALGYVHR